MFDKKLYEMNSYHGDESGGCACVCRMESNCGRKSTAILASFYAKTSAENYIDETIFIEQCFLTNAKNELIQQGDLTFGRIFSCDEKTAQSCQDCRLLRWILSNEQFHHQFIGARCSSAVFRPHSRRRTWILYHHSLYVKNYDRHDSIHLAIILFEPVSYTHLTLPTKRIV